MEHSREHIFLAVIVNVSSILLFVLCTHEYVSRVVRSRILVSSCHQISSDDSLPFYDGELVALTSHSPQYPSLFDGTLNVSFAAASMRRHVQYYEEYQVCNSRGNCTHHTAWVDHPGLHFSFRLIPLFFRIYPNWQDAGAFRLGSFTADASVSAHAALSPVELTRDQIIAFEGSPLASEFEYLGRGTFYHFHSFFGFWRRFRRRLGWPSPGDIRMRLTGFAPPVVTVLAQKNGSTLSAAVVDGVPTAFAVPGEKTVAEILCAWVWMWELTLWLYQGQLALAFWFNYWMEFAWVPAVNWAVALAVVAYQWHRIGWLLSLRSVGILVGTAVWAGRKALRRGEDRTGDKRHQE